MKKTNTNASVASANTTFTPETLARPNRQFFVYGFRALHFLTTYVTDIIKAERSLKYHQGRINGLKKRFAQGKIDADNYALDMIQHHRFVDKGTDDIAFFKKEIVNQLPAAIAELPELKGFVKNFSYDNSGDYCDMLAAANFVISFAQIVAAEVAAAADTAAAADIAAVADIAAKVEVDAAAEDTSITFDLQANNDAAAVDAPAAVDTAVANTTTAAVVTSVNDTAPAVDAAEVRAAFKIANYLNSNIDKIKNGNPDTIAAEIIACGLSPALLDELFNIIDAIFSGNNPTAPAYFAIYDIYQKTTYTGFTYIHNVTLNLNSIDALYKNSARHQKRIDNLPKRIKAGKLTAKDDADTSAYFFFG